MQQRFTMVVAVHLLLIRDRQVLLSRRFQTGYEDGKYSVPAGHVDGRESVIHAMIREAHEEVGIVINPKYLHFAHVMNRVTDRESIDFFFVCKTWEGTPRICEADKCDDIHWFDMRDLPINTIPYIRQAITQYMKKNSFSELGW